jgi:hypothetical protein
MFSREAAKTQRTAKQQVPFSESNGFQKKERLHWPAAKGPHFSRRGRTK